MLDITTEDVRVASLEKVFHIILKILNICGSMRGLDNRYVYAHSIYVDL